MTPKEPLEKARPFLTGRAMIIERTQSGKAIANAEKYFREGRPRICRKKQINHAIELMETNSFKQVEEIAGISKRTLIRAKRMYKQMSIAEAEQ